jgi:hypothetical protein
LGTDPIFLVIWFNGVAKVKLFDQTCLAKVKERRARKGIGLTAGAGT